MPSIVQKPIGNCGFTNQLYKPLWFVVHFTGGTPNLQSLYNYWISQCGTGSNSHFGIGREGNEAGVIWQFLDYHRDGACANCCLESGHAPFLPTNVNLNVRTISVECINPDTGNNGAMPQAQMDSLTWLIDTICREMGIPLDRNTTYWNDYENSHTWGDGGGGVIMHRDIAPHNRRMCPGEPYYNGQMDAIMQTIRGGNIPSGGGDKNYMQGYGSQQEQDEMVTRMWECHFYDTANMAGIPFANVRVPRKGTGIFNKWKELLLGGKYLGGVTSEEYPFSHYMVQNFTAGQMRYDKNGGAIDWIDPA